VNREKVRGILFSAEKDRAVAVGKDDFGQERNLPIVPPSPYILGGGGILKHDKLIFTLWQGRKQKRGGGGKNFHLHAEKGETPQRGGDRSTYSG